MKLSQYPLKTYKDTPAEAELTSHRLMLRSGLIKKASLWFIHMDAFGSQSLKKNRKYS